MKVVFELSRRRKMLAHVIDLIRELVARLDLGL